MHIPHIERKSHCCAMTLQSEGVGYDDLNDFLKNPCDIEFTIGMYRTAALLKQLRFKMVRNINSIYVGKCCQIVYFFTSGFLIDI